MKIKVFSKDKIWLISNSLFCFISTFIFIKGVIGFSRFVVMRYFDAWVNLDNFDVICLNGKYAEIWNRSSVISMYGIGFIAGLILVFLAYYFFKEYKSKRGLLKLWFIWLYLISVNQSIGIIIRDIPLKRDMYHALNWMLFPGELLVGMIVLSALVIIVIHAFSARKFLRLATSKSDIKENYNRRVFYFQLVTIPGLIGSAFILQLHFGDIRDYEVIELILLNISLIIPYFLFMKGEMPKKIRILRDEKTDIRSVPIIVLSALFIAVFFIVKFIYF